MSSVHLYHMLPLSPTISHYRGHAADDPVTNLLWRATLPARKPGALMREPSRWRA